MIIVIKVEANRLRAFEYILFAVCIAVSILGSFWRIIQGKETGRS